MTLRTCTEHRHVTNVPPFLDAFGFMWSCINCCWSTLVWRVNSTSTKTDTTWLI